MDSVRPPFRGREKEESVKQDQRLPELAFETIENITTAGLEDFLRKTRKRTRVTTTLPPAVWFTEVIAHPRYTALYDANGAKIPETSMYVWPFNVPPKVKAKFVKEHSIFEADTIDPACVEAEIDDPVVFGGALHSHFGHHLLDGMSRLWYHRQDMPTLYLDAHPRLLGFGSFMKDYSRLGRPRSFVDVRKPTRFASAIVPFPAIQSGFRIYDAVDTEHLAITRAALRLARKPVPAKIYLSRRCMGRRRASGEEELEQRLAEYGFAIISPETLSVVEQISMFNHAEWIVGAVGSAFHNTLFMRRGAGLTTVQLVPRTPNIRYPMIDRVKGNRSFYIRTLAPVKEVDRKVLSTKVDVEETLAILRSIGALKPRRWFGYRTKLNSPREGVPALFDKVRWLAGSDAPARSTSEAPLSGGPRAAETAT